MTSQKPIHGAPKPKDQPADMQETPPLPFAFKVGEVVNYTNGNGLTARVRIRGFSAAPHTHGGFVYLEHWKGDDRWSVGAWWFAEYGHSISPLT